MMKVLLVVDGLRLGNLFWHLLDRPPLNLREGVMGQVNEIRLHLGRVLVHFQATSCLGVGHSIVSGTLHEGGPPFSLHKLISSLHTDGKVSHIPHITFVRTTFPRCFISLRLGFLYPKRHLSVQWNLLTFLGFFLNGLRQDLHFLVFDGRKLN
jgi:hypothetical protein